MGRMTKIMEAGEQQGVTDGFDATVRPHLQRGEQVRGWVFGRTWPNDVTRLATGGLSGFGAVGGGLYGYIISKHTTGRFLIVTDRRVICLVTGTSGSTVEWAAPRGEVTGTFLSSSHLVLRNTAEAAETRIHVTSVARKQAQSVASLLR
jgi:hypothetical protein